MASNDNDRLRLDEIWELHQRYDGPVPAQYLDPAEARRLRRERGALSVHERQIADAVDAALRADEDLRWLETEPPSGERTLRIENQTHYRDRMVRNAAAGLTQAAALRARLGLPPHPLIASVHMADILAEDATDSRQLRLAV